MPLVNGAFLGSYQILAPLGEGGMGEVYRARDTKLDRDVALKILPDAFASDPERLARFEREAKTLAALNHPQIAQIYGFEQASAGAGARTALVMELVEGEDLAARIAHGPIPLDEALAIALQVIDALEAAHAQGIIHRDLKPANIKLRSDGRVKVLDFGLAKALEPQPGHATISPSLSPTLTVATELGVILGTAAYMSPEQARGKRVDHRADIWSFGCVLYEMLTGQRAFAGDEISDVLAEVLKSDPDWTLLPPDAPAAVRRVLRRCLTKDPRRRFQHIGDARIEIEEEEQASPDTITRPSSFRRYERPLWAVAVVALALAAGALWTWPRGSTTLDNEWRVDIATPTTRDPASFALSPDGRTLAFVAGTRARSQLWVRALDGSGTRALPATDEALYPFWSPDSRSIGFFAGTRLKRIDLETGETRVLANVFTSAGGAWSPSGTILYTPNNALGLFRVDAAGGSPRPLATPDGGRRRGERWPQFLPDGHRFLFHVPASAASGDNETNGVYVDDLNAPGPRRITASDAAAIYTSGRLLVIRQNALLSQPFDPATLELSGSATRIADDIITGLTTKPAISASNDGTIAFRTGALLDARKLRWFDRSGKELNQIEAVTVSPRSPNISPDGRYVAYRDTVQGNMSDVWVLDLPRDVTSRFTTDSAIDDLPVWSPDGTRLVFNSGRASGRGLYVQRRDGSPPELVLPSKPLEVRLACDWSPDGGFVLYKDLDDRVGAYDLRVLPMNGQRTPMTVAATVYDERDGQFSPDGKWIAFQSDETGQPGIYIQPFPGPGAKVRVSKGAGTQVRWNKTGKELFYIDGDDHLIAVPISYGVDGQPVIGTPIPLFTARVPIPANVGRQQYDVSRDGTRFLLSMRGDEGTVSPITLVFGWKPPTVPGR